MNHYLQDLDTAIQYLKDNLDEPIPWKEYLSRQANAEELAQWTVNNQGEVGAAFYTVALESENPEDTIHDINSSLR